MDITFNSLIPIPRIFGIAKADAFYLGYLGFAIGCDQRFARALRSIGRSCAASLSCI